MCGGNFWVSNVSYFSLQQKENYEAMGFTPAAQCDVIVVWAA